MSCLLSSLKSCIKQPYGLAAEVAYFLRVTVLERESWAPFHPPSSPLLILTKTSLSLSQSIYLSTVCMLLKKDLPTDSTQC